MQCSVAGYCVVNDVSERDFQLKRKGQWVKGKSYDNFGPIGPWFVTKDEIADPHNLGLFFCEWRSNAAGFYQNNGL